VRQNLSAVKFRIILSVIIVAIAASTLGAFFFGYRYLQSVGEEAAKRQADATASESSVSNLRTLQAQLKSKQTVIEKLGELRSSESLPQFDTERSLRIIAGQLNLPIKNVNFVNADQPTSGTSGSQAGQQAAPSSGQATAPSGTPSRNSRISFEFDRPLSYSELIAFYDAIETSAPKLKLSGLTIPNEANRNAINPGMLTLEIATT
jgi:hypothetical protein